MLLLRFKNIRMFESEKIKQLSDILLSNYCSVCVSLRKQNQYYVE